MNIELWQTKMGRQLIDGTLPKIARALERIATSLEAIEQRMAEGDDDEG